jgi:hypothetical protein
MVSATLVVLATVVFFIIDWRPPAEIAAIGSSYAFTAMGHPFRTAAC